MARPEKWDRARLLDLLRRKKLACVLSGEADEERAEGDCPNCGRAGKFTLSISTGKWSCASCGAAGGIPQLRAALGDTSIVEHVGCVPGASGAAGSPPPTLADVRAWTETLRGKTREATRARIWLHQVRRIPEEAIDEFHVGLLQHDGAWWLAFPYLEADAVRQVKLRSVSPEPKAYRRLLGGAAGLYGESAIDGESDVYLVGSEMDRLAACAYGIRPVAAASLGSGGWPKDWTPKLAGAKRIFLAYNSDPKGDHGATMVAEKLGRARCRRLRLPKRDFEECLACEVPREAIEESIKNAEPMIEAKILSIASVGEDIIRDSEALVGAPLASANLTKLVAGARNGELWAITGDSGGGKSTWMLDQAYADAERGETGLVCPFEQRPNDCVRKWGSQEIHKMWHFASESERRIAVGRLSHLRLYLLDHYGKINPNTFEEAVRYAKEELGATRLYIDHLHFMWPIQDPQREVAELGAAVEKIKDWTSKLNVVTFLVIQPKKVEGREMGMQDLRGAAQLFQTPDVICIVDRLRKPTKAMGRLRIVKCRHEAGTEGAVYQGFDRDSQHFFDMSDADVNAALGRKPTKKEKPHQEELGGGAEDDDGGSPF
jgi:hypothetical protein